MPADPRKVYEDGGWQGWGHWLGTGNQRTKTFLPFEGALAVARSLDLANQFEWHAWSKEGRRPPNVPAHSDRTYKVGGWQGWGHWLGTGNAQRGVAKEFLPFGEALPVARSLSLASSTEWKVRCKEGMCPPNVPSHPDRTCKDGGWQGWGHWLCTGNQAAGAKAFLPFDEALRVARSLRLVSEKEWRVWCRSGTRPANVPTRPDKTYVHDGWMGWQHWLRPADLGTAVAPAATRPRFKRTAAGCSGTAAAGKSRGKRRRRR